MADEKINSDAHAAYHDEKVVHNNGDIKDEKFISEHKEPSLTDAPRRRNSVALNIVENPLQVSFTPFPTRMHIVYASTWANEATLT